MWEAMGLFGWRRLHESLEEVDQGGKQGMARKLLSANVRSLTFNKKAWGVFENI